MNDLKLANSIMREFESWSKQPSRTRRAAIRQFGDNTIGAIGHGAATYDARHHHYSVKEHIAKTRAAAAKAAKARSGRSRGGAQRGHGASIGIGGEGHGDGDNANLHGSDAGHIIVPKRYDSEDGAPPAENFIENLMDEDGEGDEYGDEFVTADPEAVQSHTPDVLEPFTTKQNPLKLQEWTDKFQDEKKEKDGPLHLHSTAGLLEPFEDNTLQVRRACQVCACSWTGPVQVTRVYISAYTCIEMQGNTHTCRRRRSRSTTGTPPTKTSTWPAKIGSRLFQSTRQQNADTSPTRGCWGNVPPRPTS